MRNAQYCKLWSPKFKLKYNKPYRKFCSNKPNRQKVHNWSLFRKFYNSWTIEPVCFKFRAFYLRIWTFTTMLQSIRVFWEILWKLYILCSCLPVDCRNVFGIKIFLSFNLNAHGRLCNRINSLLETQIKCGIVGCGIRSRHFGTEVWAKILSKPCTETRLENSITKPSQIW